MSIRGQSPDAWRGRWRQGTCPIHGKGFVDDKDNPAPAKTAGVDESYLEVKCPDLECTLRATQWPGKDQHHSFFGLRAGSDALRTALTQSGDIDRETSSRPGAHARTVRTSWPLE